MGKSQEKNMGNWFTAWKMAISGTYEPQTVQHYLAERCALAVPASTSSGCPEGPGLRRVRLCRPASATSFDFRLGRGTGNAIFYITNTYLAKHIYYITYMTNQKMKLVLIKASA